MMSVIMNVQVSCKAYYFVQAMSYTASVCILTVISLERFVAIIYPMHSRRLHSMSLLRATIIVVWTIAAASGLPYLFLYDTIDIGDVDGSTLQFCMIFNESFNVGAYTCATFILWYALPLVMMAVVYTRISVVLWRSSHGPRVMSTKASPPATPSTVRLTVHHDAGVSTSQASDVTPEKCLVARADSPADWTDQDDVGSSGGSSRARLLRHLGFHQRRSARRQDHLASPQCLITVERSSDDTAVHGSAVELRSLTSGHETPRRISAVVANTDQTALSARRKVIRLLIAVVVSFAVCVLPYHVRVLWQAFSEPQITDWQQIITPLTFVFYYLNSGLNPLLYAFLSNKFRSSLSDVLCGRCAATTQMTRVTYDAGGHVTMNTRSARTASVC